MLPRRAAARQEATAAAKTTVGRAANAKGSEIDELLRSVNRDIDKIENARYNGYQDAITHLHLTQLDDKEQASTVGPFAQSLAGNLIWALSGLLAITPIGLEATIATELLTTYGQQLGKDLAAKMASRMAQERTVYRAQLATAVGVGGAMLAQFASLPTLGSAGGSGNVSSPVIELQNKLNALNTEVFHAVSRSVYPTLLRLIEVEPPAPDVDAQRYAGLLETESSSGMPESAAQAAGRCQRQDR